MVLKKEAENTMNGMRDHWEIYGMQKGQTFVREQTWLRAINKREVVERYDFPTARRDTEYKRT